MNSKGFARDAFEALANRNIKSRPLTRSDESISEEFFAYDTAQLTAKSESVSDVQVEESIQQNIRPYFGKSEINDQKIGTHPDFEYLANTDAKENHYICSMFLDIKNSTRLSFLYSLEEVSDIKNTILKAATEVVRAFDGHIHRYMGDALLAFFGGRSVTKEDSVVNVINCVAMLQSIMTDTIIPSLVSRGYQIDHLGFRVGFDFGDDQQVQWSAFGLHGVQEITATSFSVDFSAKLQSYARKNHSMLGERIIRFIDFPEKYMSIKRVMKGGEYRDFCEKEFINSAGEKIKYTFKEFNHVKYRDLLPFSAEQKSSLWGSRVINHNSFQLTCKDSQTGKLIRSVASCTEKHASIKFGLIINRAYFHANSDRFPLQIKFTKCNHGAQAAAKSEDKETVALEQILEFPPNGAQSFFPGVNIHVDEGTLYRGLHTMTVEVKDKSSNIVFRDFFGIYIH